MSRQKFAARTAGVFTAAALLTTGLSATQANADSGVWDRVAQCESGGNWGISTGNGFKGGLQFTSSTWRAYGGGQYASSANNASKAQQIAVAKRVLAGQGPGAWPVCSRKAGLTRSNGGASSSASAASSSVSSGVSSASKAAAKKAAKKAAAKKAAKKAAAKRAAARAAAKKSSTPTSAERLAAKSASAQKAAARKAAKKAAKTHTKKQYTKKTVAKKSSSSTRVAYKIGKKYVNGQLIHTKTATKSTSGHWHSFYKTVNGKRVWKKVWVAN